LVAPAALFDSVEATGEVTNTCGGAALAAFPRGVAGACACALAAANKKKATCNFLATIERGTVTSRLKE
jgi:hypothetical protein